MNQVTRAYSDLPTHVRRSAPHKLFLLTVRCAPDPQVQDLADVGGAFVNCWVNRDDLAMAEALALSSLADSGWLPQEIESWEFVTREMYVHSPDHEDDDVNYCELFDAAIAEGISCLINMWPAGEESEDADE